MYHWAKTKESCKPKADVTFGMTHTYIGYALTAYWGDVFQRRKAYKSSRNAMQHHTEAITEYSTHKPKSGSVGSSGRRCMKTPKNSFKDVENASCKEASPLATQCPYTTTYKQRYLMYGSLTSWDHSQILMTANTSLSPLVMYPNGWRPYHVELLMPSIPEGCSMKWSSLASEHPRWS